MVAMAALSATTANASSLSLEGVINRLALETDEITLAYRQVQRSTLLAEPTTSPGRITIHQDGRIDQRWESADGVYRLSIVGDRARLVTPERERRFGLAQRPRLAAMVTALRAITQGDPEALRDRFEVAVEGNANDWQLRLTARGRSPSTRSQGRRQNRSKTASVTIRGGDAIERLGLHGPGRQTEIIIEERL